MNIGDKYVCENCKFSCKYESSYNQHILTDKHKNNGVYIRPKKKNEKIVYNCENCNFTTMHKEGYKIHCLAKHANIEEKEKEFTFYCKICDFGTFYENTYNKHCESKKHLTLQTYINNT